MTDRRRLTVLGGLLVCFSVLLLPTVAALFAHSSEIAPRGGFGLTSFFFVVTYIIGLAAGVVLLLFVRQGGPVLAPRLAALFFGALALWLFRLIGALWTPDLGYTAGWLIALVLFLVYLCGLVILLMMRQTGTVESLSCSTWLPVEITCRVYGLLLIGTSVWGLWALSSPQGKDLVVFLRDTSLSAVSTTRGLLTLFFLLQLGGAVPLVLAAPRSLVQAAARALVIVHGIAACTLILLFTALVTLFGTMFSAPLVLTQSLVALGRLVLFCPLIFDLVLGEEAVASSDASRGASVQPATSTEAASISEEVAAAATRLNASLGSGCYSHALQEAHAIRALLAPHGEDLQDSERRTLESANTVIRQLEEQGYGAAPPTENEFHGPTPTVGRASNRRAVFAGAIVLVIVVFCLLMYQKITTAGYNMAARESLDAIDEIVTLTHRGLTYREYVSRMEMLHSKGLLLRVRYRPTFHARTSMREADVAYAALDEACRRWSAQRRIAHGPDYLKVDDLPDDSSEEPQVAFLWREAEKRSALARKALEAGQ